MMKYRISCCGVMLVLLAAGAAHGGEWIELFDGKTLDGWSVHSGYAKYRVDDGVIVGTASKGSPNTFLCTDEKYGDFILEFDVKVDPKLNSGVQFRSLIAGDDVAFTFERRGKRETRKLPPDRVYGYQVEIAHGGAGNVYDEARRRRFLDDFSDKPDTQAVFKPNEWNRYLIVCKGDSIRTWVNGVPCADFSDSMTARGLIGLQVHGVSPKNFKPIEVRWRNLRLLKLDH